MNLPSWGLNQLLSTRFTASRYLSRLGKLSVQKARQLAEANTTFEEWFSKMNTKLLGSVCESKFHRCCYAVLLT